MPPRLVVGVDIGGTKLAGGVVDERLQVHERVQRSMIDRDTPALLDTIADAVQELVNTAAGEVGAVGFGIPSFASVP